MSPSTAAFSTPKEGNKPLSCFEVQQPRKDIEKEKQGILLMLKAQRFQAITSMSVTRKVEGISLLHLVCPLLPSSSSQRGKGDKRVCECFSRVELLLAFAAVVQEAMLRAWFVAGLLLAGLCFLAFEHEGHSGLPEGAGLGENVLHLFHV